MPEEKRRGSRRATQNNTPQADDYGHLQPQATDLEKAVLGSLMVEKDAYFHVCEILTPESFYEKRHQQIFEAIRSLNAEEKPVDILTVAERLDAMGVLEDVGGRFYITQLSSLVTSSAHIEYHARLVAQKALARALITFTSGIQTKAFEPTQDVDELMQEAEGELFRLSQQNMRKDYTQIDSVVQSAYESIQRAAANAGNLSGIPSLYHKLDEITGGWQNSDLVILAARPAMGKTAFALSMAKNIAIDQRIPMAFFSLEMSNEQLIKRVMSNAAEVESEKLRSGQLAPYEWGQLDSAMQAMQGAKLFLDDTPGLSVFELRTKARRLVREEGVKIIMIDYLQLMNAQGMKFSGRQEEVSTISRSLKGLAKELNIPILALSQLNRGIDNRVAGDAEGKGTNRPQLSDLRESGAIEQDADMVLFIHRPEYYHIYQDPKTGRDLRGKAEIIIAKHRNGRLDDVVLTFKGKYTRFENPDTEGAPPPGGGSGMIVGSKLRDADGASADFPPASAYDDLPTPPPEIDAPF